MMVPMLGDVGLGRQDADASPHGRGSIRDSRFPVFVHQGVRFQHLRLRVTRLSFCSFLLALRAAWRAHQGGQAGGQG